MSHAHSKIDNLRKATRSTDGTGQVAGLLNELNPEERNQLMLLIEKDHPDLAEAIRDALFTFEDFIYVEDRGLQKMLRNIDQRTLAKALKSTSAELKEKIISNLSKRAGLNVLEELELLGPTRLDEVRELQKELARQARKLNDEGQLTIIRPGDLDPLV